MGSLVSSGANGPSSGPSAPSGSTWGQMGQMGLLGVKWVQVGSWGKTWTASVHTLHMPKPVMMFVFKVLWQSAMEWTATEWIVLCRSTQLHATTSCRSQFATTCDSSYVLQSSVLQSTTPVLLCTTKYYSSTTKYYSSTSLYYKVLLQYYSVLQSITLYYKVLLRTTKY